MKGDVFRTGGLRKPFERLQGLVVSAGEAGPSGYPPVKPFHMTEDTAQRETLRDHVDASVRWREGRWGGSTDACLISSVFMRNGDKMMPGVDKRGQRSERSPGCLDR